MFAKIDVHSFAKHFRSLVNPRQVAVSGASWRRRSGRLKAWSRSVGEHVEGRGSLNRSQKIPRNRHGTVRGFEDPGEIKAIEASVWMLSHEQELSGWYGEVTV